MPGWLRWADEALGRETPQFIGSDRDNEGTSRTGKVAMLPLVGCSDSAMLETGCRFALIPQYEIVAESTETSLNLH